MGVFNPPLVPKDAPPVTEHELAARTTGERVTLDQIEAFIDREYYFTAAEGVDGADLNAMREEQPDIPVQFCALSDDVSVDGTLLAPLRLLTFCVLVLKNGFTVHGTSACADPANFRKDIGQRFAREDAISKLWPLLGFELRTKLANQARAEGPASPAPSSTTLH